MARHLVNPREQTLQAIGQAIAPAGDVGPIQPVAAKVEQRQQARHDQNIELPQRRARPGQYARVAVLKRAVQRVKFVRHPRGIERNKASSTSATRRRYLRAAIISKPGYDSPSGETLYIINFQPLPSPGSISMRQPQSGLPGT